MNLLTLRVNGEARSAPAEPRTHLADFLRDGLHLTGTHLGCEHGVCGACTVLMDGQPVRSCTSFAVACQGREITTVEGYDDDALMRKLREAFTRHHALQCGFCTPGMLASARDIVLRVPHADESRVRLELAGNLCRCTGYQGIVDAILDVLDAQRREADQAIDALRRRLEQARRMPVGPEPAASAAAADRAATAVIAGVAQGANAAASATADTEADVALPGIAPAQGHTIDAQFDVPVESGKVWDFMGDLPAVAGCLPGATILSQDGERVRGKIAVRFGPMTASFSGAARLERNEADRSALLRGAGQDSISKSRAQADIRYRIEALPQDHTRVKVSMVYALQGPLAQFSRSGLVRDFVQRMVADFGKQVEHRLTQPTTGAPSAPPPPASGLSLLFSVLAQRLRRWFGLGD